MSDFQYQDAISYRMHQEQRVRELDRVEELEQRIRKAREILTSWMNVLLPGRSIAVRDQELQTVLDALEGK